MPFDRTDPVQLAALKSEFQNDPVGQGYLSPVNYFASGGVRELLIAIKRDDAGGATATRSNLTVEDILEAITANPAEYAVVVTNHAQADSRQRFVDNLLRWYGPQMTPQGPVSNPIPARFFNELNALFSLAQAPNIRGALIAEMSGPIRREEALFGDDTVLSRDDVRAALAYTA